MSILNRIADYIEENGIIAVAFEVGIAVVIVVGLVRCAFS